jgi:hypothetical protein
VKSRQRTKAGTINRTMFSWIDRKVLNFGKLE